MQFVKFLDSTMDDMEITKIGDVTIPVEELAKIQCNSLYYLNKLTCLAVYFRFLRVSIQSSQTFYF